MRPRNLFLNFSFIGLAAVCRMTAALIVLNGAEALAGEAGKEKDAQAFAKSQRYENCVTLARKNPTKSYDLARAWEAEGGEGFAPRHCMAVSLIAIQNFYEAAKILEKLYEDVRENNDNPGVAIDLLRQAGQAWMLASENERAVGTFTAILAIDPDNPEILLDRSIVLAEARRYWEALDDLNRVIEAQPERVEALILRANAYRKVRAPELAMEDIKKALAIEPQNPDALFERALNRRNIGDPAGARTDLQAVIMLSAGRPLAHSARRALHDLGEE